MKRSIGEIFTALERTKLCAHDWAHSQPERDESLSKFIQDLYRIGLELENSVLVNARSRGARHGSTVDGNLRNIVNCFVPAVTFAKLILEQQTEYTVPLKRFQKELHRVRTELITIVDPGVFLSED